MTDKGNTLNITDNFFDYTRYNNKRVMLTYSILSSVETAFQVTSTSKNLNLDTIVETKFIPNFTQNSYR